MLYLKYQALRFASQLCVVILILLCGSFISSSLAESDKTEKPIYYSDGTGGDKIRTEIMYPHYHLIPKSAEVQKIQQSLQSLSQRIEALEVQNRTGDQKVQKSNGDQTILHILYIILALVFGGLGYKILNDRHKRELERQKVELKKMEIETEQRLVQEFRKNG